MIQKTPSIVILTGAGISAESGIRTFRDPGGLWEGHDPMKLASVQAFKRDPLLVQRFYNERRKKLLDPTIQVNAAHLALADLEREWIGDFLLITQNVDDLHDVAGSKKLIHMHGELFKVRCLKSGQVFFWKDAILPESWCPCCGRAGTLRPHIVWFGESPFDMPRIYAALETCDIFISIGTSGVVYPAAGFIDLLSSRAARTIGINPDVEAIEMFGEQRVGLASVEVPRLVTKLLSSYSKA